MSAGESVVRRSEEDGVELVVLRNPPVNALSRALLGELEAAFRTLPEATRCVVLTGDGSYFSAGADLKELSTLGIEHAPELLAQGLGLFDRIARYPAPVVVAINGLALGGGLELALAGDLRLAGDSAKLGAPEVGYGLMPAYGGTQRLPRAVGTAKAKELIFTGAMIGAAEALRIGLVQKVVPSGQELRAARDLAHTIASRAPRAVQAAKAAIGAGAESPLAEGLAEERRLFLERVLPTEDLAEGLAAFQQHRPPKFRGA